MATDLLKNVRERLHRSHQILGLNAWLLKELTTFKKRISFDLCVKIRGEPHYFKGVRIRHRTPQAGWTTKGGNRYDTSVTLSAMESHAVEMSFKSWLKDLPYGGAKGGVTIDPSHFSIDELEIITKKFVDECVENRTIGSLIDIPAPDVGTNSLTMHWMKEHYAYKVRSGEINDPHYGAVVTGKPLHRNPQESGCPGRREATGLGMWYALDEYQKQGIIHFSHRPRVIIQGFGNVGMHFAYYLHAFDYADIIAVVDRYGGVYNKQGLNIPELITYAQSNAQKTVSGFTHGEHIERDDFIGLECDIIAPCALEGVFTDQNAYKVKASVIVEGANGATTPEADSVFKTRGIAVLPDIDVNGGGVVVSFFEHQRNTNSRDPRVPHGGFKDVTAALELFMRRSVQEVIETKIRYRAIPDLRIAAYVRALEKVAPLFRTKRLTDVEEEFACIEKDMDKHPWE